MIPLHALFQRRIDGDDALLRLARLRFEQAGLAAEVYAGSASDLEWILRFAPAGPRLPTVHLPRDLDLLDPGGPERVIRLAQRFGHRVSGFVVHDRRHLPDRLPELAEIAERVSRALTASGGAHLFIEYAAGLTVDRFAAIGDALRDTSRIGLCVDVGHVGIRQARWDFERRRPDLGRDLISLHAGDVALPGLVHDVQASVATGLEAVLTLVRTLAHQGGPVHFHLHDGHPLVEGLSDHFGYLLRLPIPFAVEGMASLAPLFGVTGLRRIVQTATSTLGPQLVSFTLEIHQHEGRLPLTRGEAETLFPHWRDLANAERMNLWLRDLADNAILVRSAYPPT